MLVDGAGELREDADCLKNYRSDSDVCRDFKHDAANVFKSLVGSSPRFNDFSSQIGSILNRQTAARIHRTQKSHYKHIKRPCNHLEDSSALTGAGFKALDFAPAEKCQSTSLEGS